MKPDRGVVLMGLVVLLAIGGLTLVSFAESAATARKRHREAELLWVGQQYRRALESYYLASPGSVKHLPVSLDELLLDPRFPQPVRHIRKLYADPLEAETPWGVMRQGNQIIGVYSQSAGRPLRRVDLGPGLEGLDSAQSYASWRFMYLPRAVSASSSRPAQPSIPSPTKPSP